MLFRSRRWWIAALAAALVAGGVLAAVLTSGGSKKQAQPQTIVRTVTGPSQTVRETITEPGTTPRTTAPSTPSSGSGSQLNLAGYQKLQAGDLNGALPLLEQAVQKLDGTRSLDEGYAKYNLAYARFALGDCTGVLALLDQAQAIEGKRSAIDDLRHRAKKGCKD